MVIVDPFSTRRPVPPKAPEICPVEWEDDEMSPLSLPLSMFLDSESGCFDETSFTIGDSSVRTGDRFLELGIRQA